MRKKRTSLKETEKMDEVRICGDVITANIYRIHQGDSSVTGMDYESGEEITVPLDISLNPAKNAQSIIKNMQK